MSFKLLRLLGTLLLIALAGGTTAAMVRASFPDAWRRWAKRAFAVAGAVGVLSSLAWFGGRLLGSPSVYLVGTVVSATLLVTFMALFLTSPLWAGFAWGTRKVTPRVADPARRAFLGKMSGVLPVAAAAAGPTGATAAMLAPVMRRVDIPVPDLPPAFDGLKLLQLTDVHLGTFIDVDQVERVVEAARAEAPDVIVLTGDVADDYDKLGPALAALGSLAPPLGLFGIYGNHEVYRGRVRCGEIYEDSPARLLCEEGVVLERDGARLWLGGCDDPATLGREHRTFLERTVQRTVATCPDDVTTRVLLSHRPEGFEEAARHGVTLTLAGHTHGAQMALFGRSLLAPILPRSYLLGHYEHEGHHLYTSAGLGHWFPFRLGCPCEAALITLRRGRGRATVA